MEVININKPFERFLETAKDSFCKWECQYYKLNEIKTNSASCERCDEGNIKIDFCEHCRLEDFINEIMDSREITVNN